MNKKLFISFFCAGLLALCAYAQEGDYDFSYDNGLLTGVSIHSQESNKEIADRETQRELQSEIVKRQYALSQLNNEDIPNTEKISKQRTLEREIEYYQMRLEEVKDRD